MDGKENTGITIKIKMTKELYKALDSFQRKQKGIHRHPLQLTQGLHPKRGG